MHSELNSTINGGNVMKKYAVKVLSFLAVTVISLSLISAPASALEENRFSDVTSDKWYYSEVQKAFDEGIMEGTSDSTFEPNGTVTREMFATALARLILGKDTVDSMNNYYIGNFKDKKYLKPGTVRR